MKSFKLAIALIKKIFGVKYSVDFDCNFADLMLAFVIFVFIFIIPCFLILGAICSTIF